MPRGAKPGFVSAQCLCGRVRMEIEFPAFWAWHDHSASSRVAHGAAYATYVGTWRKRFNVVEGRGEIRRFEDETNRSARNFCGNCGTPLFYERARSPHMVDIPRALFAERVGRQPLYHLSIDDLRDWAWIGAPLRPLKGYPGVVWEGPQRKKRPRGGAF